MVLSGNAAVVYLAILLILFVITSVITVVQKLSKADDRSVVMRRFHGDDGTNGDT